MSRVWPAFAIRSTPAALARAVGARPLYLPSAAARRSPPAAAPTSDRARRLRWRRTWSASASRSGSLCRSASRPSKARPGPLKPELAVSRRRRAKFLTFRCRQAAIAATRVAFTLRHPIPDRLRRRFKLACQPLGRAPGVRHQLATELRAVGLS